jgi:hypothetical protein
LSKYWCVLAIPKMMPLHLKIVSNFCKIPGSTFRSRSVTRVSEKTQFLLYIGQKKTNSTENLATLSVFSVFTGAGVSISALWCQKTFLEIRRYESFPIYRIYPTRGLLRYTTLRYTTLRVFTEKKSKKNPCLNCSASNLVAACEKIWEERETVPTVVNP